MIRSKLGLLGLCAMVLGVMAISASGAQAAGSWLVLNAAENAETEVKVVEGKVNLLAALTGEIDTPEPKLLTHLVSLTVTVTCTNFTTSGISLEPEGKLSEGGRVVFTGCSVVAKDSKGVESGECSVKSPEKPVGTIESEEGKGELVLHELAGGAKDVLTKIEPKTAGGAFATLKFAPKTETSTCLLPASNPVKGVLYVKDCAVGGNGAETFAVKHLIEQGPLTSLVVGAHSVEHLETSIDGSAWVKLTGAHENLKWRAMGV
jgi:hypothetical protein